jgi:hypothetical protein
MGSSSNPNGKPDIARVLSDYKHNMKEDLLALWKIWVVRGPLVKESHLSIYHNTTSTTLIFLWHSLQHFSISHSCRCIIVFHS